MEVVACNSYLPPSESMAWPCVLYKAPMVNAANNTRSRRAYSRLKKDCRNVEGGARKSSC